MKRGPRGYDERAGSTRQSLIGFTRPYQFSMETIISCFPIVCMIFKSFPERLFTNMVKDDRSRMSMGCAVITGLEAPSILLPEIVPQPGIRLTKATRHTAPLRLLLSAEDRDPGRSRTVFQRNLKHFLRGARFSEVARSTTNTF